jgi:hypothetical protein
MTIDQSGKITDAHKKDDERCTSTFKSIIEGWDIPFEVFAPMSKEEFEVKKKRIEASKKIVDPKLTIEMAQKCLEDGADPNAEIGKPLKNAVESNNKEVAKFLLEKGAMPNISENSSEMAISGAKDLEMLQILVSAGATVTSTAFMNVVGDSSAVEYLLKSGMDPNFAKGYAFREAAKIGDTTTMKLLLKYADNIPDDKLSIQQKKTMMISERRCMALKKSSSGLFLDTTIFILNSLLELKYDDLMEDPEGSMDDVLVGAKSSSKSEAEKTEFTKNIKNWFSSKFGGLKESKSIKSFKTFKHRFI